MLAVAAAALAAAACGTTAASPRASTTTSPGTTTSTAVAPTTTTTTTVPSTTTTTTVVQAGATAALGTEVVKAAQAGKQAYTVSCAHPVLSGAAGAGPIDAAISATVSKTVTSFEAYVDADAPLSAYGFGPSTLTCTWSKAWLSPTLGSLSFTASEFPAGAAHPFATITTFDFDPATGRLYTLADLFSPASDWLQVLSHETATLLPAVLGQSFGLPAGYGIGDPKDFAAFELESGGLVITFQEYQVAPYAWGTPTITIPYSALAAIAAPGGPLTATATFGS